MVIADNIQRIQTAKTNIRTSIINKGVDVPSNAKIDTYPGYIDQIQAGGVPEEQYDAVVDGLKLFYYNISHYDHLPNIFLNISFIENGAAYGCVLINDYYNDANRYLLGYRKRSGGDIEYLMGGAGSDDGHFGSIGEQVCYKNSTSVRYFYTYSYVNNPYTGNVSYFIIQMDWDFTNGSTPVLTSKTQGSSTRISDYTIDTTGYTQITTSEWVQSVNGTNENDDCNIYLVLKA